MMELSSPAKINLNLEVLAKRADGYHELRTLMCPVSLADTVRVGISGDRIRLRCDAEGIPEDASNLAWRAAEAFCRALAQRGAPAPAGIAIELVKRVPAGGGLGGGSSNAAAVLTALNRLLDHPFDRPFLASLAAGIGADVPFFLLGKPAVASGIGDRLQPCPGLTAHPVLIVDPGFPISTAAVYAGLNLALTKCRKRNKNFGFRGRNFQAARHLCNDLEAAVLPRHPVLAAIKNALMESGALGSLMSGSGACVFGLFAGVAEAERALERISRVRNWRPHLADMIV